MKFDYKDALELLKAIKELDIKMVDLRFTDLPGTAQHFTIPFSSLNEDILSFLFI